MERPGLSRVPDGLANPQWVKARANDAMPLPPLDRNAAPEISPDEYRRRGLELTLAAKLLNAHLRNRMQLMQSAPTDLTGLPPEQAALLIRAMIAAGHADGGMSQGERRRLVALARSGIADADTRDALFAEMEAPPSIEQLVRLVDTPVMAERFYAVSAAVAGIDQPINRAYLGYLAVRLDIPADVVLRVNREAAAPRPRIRRQPG